MKLRPLTAAVVLSLWLQMVLLARADERRGDPQRRNPPASALHPHRRLCERLHLTLYGLRREVRGRLAPLSDLVGARLLADDRRRLVLRRPGELGVRPRPRGVA